MEYYPITQIEKEFHIGGFPNAAKLVRIGGQKAKRLSDLSLHKYDLDFAAECLEAINHLADKPDIIRKSLWHSAIVHFFKCFGDSSARFQLNAMDKIYRGDIQGQEVFKYFQSLRNKFLVHDENSYAQCIPGAVLNKPDHPYKIEKIVCFSALADTLNQPNYSNLKLLIQKAKSWVVNEFDMLCGILTKELEAESYDDLLSRKGITYKAPTANEIHEKRNVP
jgi:hypothetical protein